MGYFPVKDYITYKEIFTLVFSSLVFLCIFLPLVLITYNLSPNMSYKNLILTIASLIFYAWGEPVWVVLLILTSIVNYLLGILIEKLKKPVLSKLILIFSVILNLSSLCIFKYSGFFIENINSVFNLSLTVPTFTLPIGISFYTFQALSYIVDVYKGDVRAQNSFIRFLTYLSMFPQLIAGPIVRYRDISTELRKRTVTLKDFSEGSRKFICGLTKKVVLANTTGSTADMLLTTIHPTVMSSWLGILFFTFQIYFDFSGYSDMAIGLGKMFGFHFKENFEHPYNSRSITEFWRRWHISLSSFFRDYIYIPLGGNRRHHILNLFIVWSLTGLWHGASWNFVLWGFYYGVVLFTEKKLFGGILKKLPFPLCHIYTIFVVMLGWTLFYFTDFNALIDCFKSMFGVGVRLYDLVSVSTLCQNVILLIICIVAVLPWPKILYRHFVHTYPAYGAIIEPIVISIGFIVSFVMLIGQSYNPFLYFRF